MIKFSICLIFSLSLTNSYSCSCLPIKIPIEESIGKADVIFKGTVLRVDTVKMKYEYAGDSTSQIQNTNHFLLKHLVILKVAKMLKGESKSDTILILTGEGGGDF